MPLALDDAEARHGLAGALQGGFDLQTATTLFWKPVPLLLRQADREDQSDELTFRILTGVLRSNHNMRVLRVHISSETDLFFLHSLEVSEEDFQSLKNEQGILVDFASFPVKIITLLDKCTTTQPMDAPRFQAVLTVRGGESIFRIVETNDFKQLPHITLAFRPGNDVAVKQFLAFRLLEVKSDVETLTSQLGKSEGDLSYTSNDLMLVRQQLASLQEQYDKHLLEVQAEAKTQRAVAHEERIRERAELKEAHERELSDVNRRHQDVLSQATTKLNELDAENRKLRDIKYELDSKVSELSHRLGSAEGANRSLEDEVSRLRALSATLGAERAERDLALNETKAKLGAAEEKVASQSDVIESQRSRIRDLEASVRSAEARCIELKEALAAEAGRVKEAQQEVVKGNNVIEKLTSDLKLSKEKVKRKQAILVRQEEEMSAREAQLQAAAKDTHQATQTIEQLKAEVSSLRQENGELRTKIDDSRQQLQSNEQMIRWLNQQVTEAQLGTAGAGGALPHSRYTSTYRPSTTTAALPAPTPAPHSLQSATATPAAALLPAPPLPVGHATAVVAATPGGAAAGMGSTAAGGGGANFKYSTSTSSYTSGLGQSGPKTYLNQPLQSPARTTPGSELHGAGGGAGMGYGGGGPTPYGSTMSVIGGPMRYHGMMGGSGAGDTTGAGARGGMTQPTPAASRFFSR